MSNKLNFIKDPDTDEKLLGFQYYNLYNIVTIPIISNGKIPFLKEWNRITNTVHPTYADQNIAILTGKTNNITVLDIDSKEDGILFWKQLSKQYPDIKTPTVNTPSGGVHLYFKFNKKLHTMYRIKVDDKKIGWDIKSNNSIIIAPPSIINGNKYKWVKNKSLDDVNILNMPKWLEKFILDHLK
jgi:hypothetical protein